jgi:hypothetical protein
LAQLEKQEQELTANVREPKAVKTTKKTTNLSPPTRGSAAEINHVNVNRHAERAINNVRSRLLRKDPMSEKPHFCFPDTASHVAFLVNQAADPANHAEAFVGWSPHC